MRRLTILGAALLVAALAAFAAVDASGAARTKVKLGHTSLGHFLVTSKGRTLYLFEKDPLGRSRCSGACAQAWPPLIAHGRLKAGKGLQRKHLKTIKRADGRRQVTYFGHPLYRYAGDTRAGQTTGEGSSLFGAKWYVVKANGHKIDND
jgi:predicted lipoprotein with Yx(FWY)xxD motif